MQVQALTADGDLRDESGEARRALEVEDLPGSVGTTYVPAQNGAVGFEDRLGQDECVAEEAEHQELVLIGAAFLGDLLQPLHLARRVAAERGQLLRTVMTCSVSAICSYSRRSDLCNEMSSSCKMSGGSSCITSSLLRRR